VTASCISTQVRSCWAVRPVPLEHRRPGLGAVAAVPQERQPRQARVGSRGAAEVKEQRAAPDNP